MRWHRYQELALDAFERDRAAGSTKTLIVAPPGAGKTLIGLEVVRRIGVPAVVLCRTQTIQRQWHDKQELFGKPREELRVLTYQALCQAEDPDDLLHGLAERQWAQERAKATGEDQAVILSHSRTWTGEAATHRERELRRIIAHLKRRAAAGGLRKLSAEELLSESARQRVAELRQTGVGTVVLDECHHLASLWGALLAVLAAADRARRPRLYGHAARGIRHAGTEVDRVLLNSAAKPLAVCASSRRSSTIAETPFARFARSSCATPSAGPSSRKIRPLRSAAGDAVCSPWSEATTASQTLVRRSSPVAPSPY